MKKILFITSAALLAFNGLGALVGGWSLITDPSGNGIRLSLCTVEGTPFKDFLVPGIILFVCMGLFSMLALLLLVFRFRNASSLVFAEGVLLTGWIVIQYFLTQTYHPLQLIMGTVGLLLICCGYKLYQSDHYA